MATCREAPHGIVVVLRSSGAVPGRQWRQPPPNGTNPWVEHAANSSDPVLIVGLGCSVDLGPPPAQLMKERLPEVSAPFEISRRKSRNADDGACGTPRPLVARTLKPAAGLDDGGRNIDVVSP